MIELDIDNTTKRKVPVRTLREAARVVSRELKIRRKMRVNLVLVNDAEIKRLNREFLGRNYPTNVLSFGPYRDSSFISPQRKQDYDGEVVISLGTAAREAQAGHITLMAELAWLLLHGLLHLNGYNHENVSDRTIARMQARERKILARLAKNN